jgi:hypothetical protein
VRLDVWKALSEIPDCATRFVTSEHFFEHFDRLEGHRLRRVFESMTSEAV